MAASKKKAAKSPAKKTAKTAPKKAAKSPAKKAAAAKPVNKKAAAKPAKKAASKKAEAPQKAAKTANKPAAKAAKAPPKKSAKTAAKAAAAKPPAKKAEVEKAAPAVVGSPPAKKKSKKKRGDSGATGKKTRAKKPILPTGPRHPKLGYKWICFGCAAKFYDLGKEKPICPKCEANQLDRPPEEPKASSDAPKAKVVRPMAQLLDDEEPAPPPGDEMAMDGKAASPAEEMFDETEGDVGLDIDDEAEPDAAAEPPEIDIL
jgi:hypothetical protein